MFRNKTLLNKRFFLAHTFKVIPPMLCSLYIVISPQMEQSLIEKTKMEIYLILFR